MHSIRIAWPSSLRMEDNNKQSGNKLACDPESLCHQYGTELGLCLSSLCKTDRHWFDSQEPLGSTAALGKNIGHCTVFICEIGGRETR